MSQTSTERLRDYLAQLPPQSQALLMREFERAHRARRGHRGRQLRARAAAQGRARNRGRRRGAPAHRRSGAAVVPSARAVSGRRQFSRSGPGRSAAHRWCRSGNGWSATGRRSRRANSRPRSPRCRQSGSNAGARERGPQVPARRSRRDHRARGAGRPATTSSARSPVSARPTWSRICCRSARCCSAREALETLGSRLPGYLRVFGGIPDRLGRVARSTFPRCRRRNCCRSRCRWSCSG